MKVTVNSKLTETKAENLARLAEELALPATGVAMAINNRMVPRTAWSEQALAEGDSILIIKAVCGG